MRGFHNVLRRITMATFAVGLTFGIPNSVFAQTGANTGAQQTARLPWQTSTYFTGATPFDKDWARVVSDTQQLLRRFAAPYQFQDALAIDQAVRTETTSALWTPNMRPSIPQIPKAPSTEVRTIRATLMPVEFTSGVAAESRSLDGVLVGVQFEVVD